MIRPISFELMKNVQGPVFSKPWTFYLVSLLCYFNGTNNWWWNNSKWNYDSSFLVLVRHLYGFSRKSCQFLWSVVALKTAVPTHFSSGWGSQRRQAGLIRYITISLHQHTHDASISSKCLIVTTWNCLRGTLRWNTTQSAVWGCRLLGCTKDLPANRSTKDRSKTTDLAEGT